MLSGDVNTASAPSWKNTVTSVSPPPPGHEVKGLVILRNGLELTDHHATLESPCDYLSEGAKLIALPLGEARWPLRGPGGKLEDARHIRGSLCAVAVMSGVLDVVKGHRKAFIQLRSSSHQTFTVIVSESGRSLVT